MLNGRPALIVEGEFLIALDIQRMLEAFDIGQTLFARDAAEARRMEAQWSDIALAVVEIMLDYAANRNLVDALSAAGIPVIVIAAEIGLRQIEVSQDIPVLLKPVSEEALASAVRTALAMAG